MRKSNFLIAIIVLSSFLSMYVPSVKAVSYLPFIVGVYDSPHNVDPANSYDRVSFDTLNQVYEGLYAYNLASPDLEVIPQLARSMGWWDSTNTNLTVELRQDVTFQDGTAFNAEVVKWNFDRINYFAENEMSDPYTLYKNNDGALIVKETVIVDEFTIKFVLNKPYSIWEQMLAFTGSFMIKPDPAFATEFLTLSDPAIGTGPFKLITIEPDKSIIFDRYMDYYSGPANISTMVYSVINDIEVTSTAMLNHELHIGGILAEHLDQAEADPDITIERVKTNVVFYLAMGFHTIPYEVRKAMQFGWNYTYYLQESLKGESYEIHQPIPDGMRYNNESIEGLPYYNLTEARQYMLDCTDPNVVAAVTASGLTIDSTNAEWINVAFGSTPLFEANFTRYTSITLEKILTQLVDNYAYFGVKVVDWHIGDWGVWMEWSQEPGNKELLDITLGGWGADYNDAINMIEPLYQTGSTYNIAQLDDAALDTMMSENYALTGQARADSFDAIVKRLIVDLAPCMYISQRGSREFYNNKYVSNIQEMLNVFNYAYWYNVIYSPQEGTYDFPIDNPTDDPIDDPTDDPTSDPFADIFANIPGFPIGFLTINTILVILGIVWKQRILKSEN